MARTPKPPGRRDRIAERLIEAKQLVVDAHEANLVHARAQMTRFRQLAELVRGIDQDFRDDRAEVEGGIFTPTAEPRSAGHLREVV